MKKLIVSALAAAALGLPAAPAVADTGDLGRAGITKCTGAYRGIYVWWYDLDGTYHRTDTCVYVGPGPS